MTDFECKYKETVKKFLSGVVIIDDNISWENIKADDKLKIPAGKPSLNEEMSNPDMPEAAKRPDSSINAREIINSFSKEGIHCVVFPWEKSSSDLPLITMNTDIAIFDWKLSETDNKKTAELLIRELIENSKNCFRYIVIYTIEDKKSVADIVKGLKIENCARVKSPQENIIDYKYGTDSHVSYRVQIIKKVDDSKLCDAVINGFSNFNAGFLRNAILTSITSIRENTFKLLSLYPDTLDKAAISHFTSLQSSPLMFDQASTAFHDYISKIISDNILDVLLYSESLEEALNSKIIISALEFAKAKESISIFLHEKNEKIDTIDYEQLIQSVTHDEFKKIIVDGLDVSISGNNQEDQLKTIENKIKTSFSNGKNFIRIEGKVEAFIEFSYNDCCRGYEKFSPSGRSERPLKFGTIVTDENNYYLCLQPLCDSIRLNENTAFPFVRLESVDLENAMSNNKPFSYVVKKDGKFIALKAFKKPHQTLCSFMFSPDKATKSVQSDQSKSFKNVDGKTFDWIAELKEPYTQIIMHNIAAHGTRIGVDKFEWLRHKSKMLNGQ